MYNGVWKLLDVIVWILFVGAAILVHTRSAVALCRNAPYRGHEDGCVYSRPQGGGGNVLTPPLPSLSAS